MGSTSQLDRRKDKNTASEGTLFMSAIRLLYRPLKHAKDMKILFINLGILGTRNHSKT